MKKTKTNGNTFYRITNEDIYLKLERFEEMMNKNKRRIALNTWVSSTALSIVLGLLLGRMVF